MDVAIVTGATGGIGKSICKRLSREGFAILAFYSKNTEQARMLHAEISKEGGVCHTHSADLSNADGIKKACEFVDNLLIENPLYRVLGLVNNAAKLLSPSFFNTRPEDFDEYFAVNTKAAFFLSQHAANIMVEGASIVNISSASAHFSSPGDITYAMSKAAIESLTLNMAEAVASKHIRVNAVIPGFTDNGHQAFQDPAVLEYMSTFALMGSVSQPETVANAVSFLISNESSRTTGAFVDVTGGSLLGIRGQRMNSVRDHMR